MQTGKDKAWEDLERLAAGDVCRRSLSDFDHTAHAYTVPVFGHEVIVKLGQRTFEGRRPEGELIVNGLGYFSHLAILHYLIGAQNVAPAGRLIRPADLKTSGGLYEAGSHVLPLDALAARYGDDADVFLRQGFRFNGARRTYGDAALELLPFPRLPVTLILWRGDDEFPARADLLFDATGDRHVPPDVLWSVAMLCVKIMMPPPRGEAGP